MLWLLALLVRSVLPRAAVPVVAVAWLSTVVSQVAVGPAGPYTMDGGGQLSARSGGFVRCFTPGSP